MASKFYSGPDPRDPNPEEHLDSDSDAVYHNNESRSSTQNQRTLRRRQPTEDLPRYDRIQPLPKEKISANDSKEKCTDVFSKSSKCLAYVVIFVLVLGTAVISKGLLLFMVSQIRPDKTTAYCDASTNNELQSYETVANLAERAQWIWAIFFCYLVPQVWTFLQSVIQITFKNFEIPKIKAILLVSLFETIHTIGIATLIFVALPELNAIKGVMLTNCVCLLPAVLLLISRFRTKAPGLIIILLDGAAIVAQLTAFLLWPIADSQKLTHAKWAIPIGLLCTSFGWWENFTTRPGSQPAQDQMSHQEQPIGHVTWGRTVTQDGRRIPMNDLYVESQSKPKRQLLKTCMDVLYGAKVAMMESRSRYFVYSFLSLWKMAIFFVTMTLYVCFVTSNQQPKDRFFIFKNFLTADGHRDPLQMRQANVTQTIYKVPHLDGTSLLFSSWSSTASEGPSAINPDPMAAILSFVIQALITNLCYVVGVYACRIQVQKFSFAVPLTFATPVTLSALVAVCGMKNTDVCFAKNVIPKYLFWECPPNDTYDEFLLNQQVWIWVFWFLSQIWITFHIWTSQCDRLASTEMVFVNPMYEAFLIDQSLALNRQRDDKTEQMKAIEETKKKDSRISPDLQELKEYLNIDPEHFFTEDNTESMTKIIACITMWRETEKEMFQALCSIMRLNEEQYYRERIKQESELTPRDYYKLQVHIFFDDAFGHRFIDLNAPKLNKYVKTLVRLMDKAAKKVCGKGETMDLPQICPTPYGGQLCWTLPGKNNCNKLYVHLKDKTKIRHKKRWSQVMYMYYLLGLRLYCSIGESWRLDTTAENTFILALDGDIDFSPKSVHLLVDLMKKNKKLGAACGRIHPVGTGLMAWFQKFEYAISHWLQKAAEHVLGCVLCSPGCFSLYRAQALMNPDVIHTYTTQATKPRQYLQYDQGEDRWLCTLLLKEGYRVEYAAAAEAFTHCPVTFTEFYNQRRRWVPSTMANIFDLLQHSKEAIRNNDEISILYIGYQWILMVSSLIGPGTVFLMVVGSMVSAIGISMHRSMLINLIPITVFILVCMYARQKVQIAVAQVLTTIYALLMMAVLVGILIEGSVEGWLAPSSFFLLLTTGMMIVTAILHPLEVECLFCGVIYWCVIPSMYMLLIIYSTMNMNDPSWGVRDTSSAQASMENKAKKAKKKRRLYLGKDKNGYAIKCGNLCHCTMCSQSSSEDEAPILDNLVEETSAEKLEKLKNPNWIEQVHKCVHETLTQTKSKEEKECDCWREHQHLSEKETEFWNYVIETYLLPASKLDDTKDYKPMTKEEHIIDELKKMRNEYAFIFFIINALFVVMVFLMQIHQDTIYIEYPNLGNTNITWEEQKNSNGDIIWEIDVTQEMYRIEPIGLIFLFIYAIIMAIQFLAMLVHRFGTFSLILATTDLEFCNPSIPSHVNHAGIEEDQHARCEDGDGEENVELQFRPRPDGRRRTLAQLHYAREKSKDMPDSLDARYFKMIKKNKGRGLSRRGVPKANTAMVRRRSIAAFHRETDLQQPTRSLAFFIESNVGGHSET